MLLLLRVPETAIAFTASATKILQILLPACGQIACQACLRGAQKLFASLVSIRAIAAKTCNTTNAPNAKRGEAWKKRPLLELALALMRETRTLTVIA